uniref:Uncharacterized protein n=1 Tax=Magnetococcus massalia (strain MO-1) TaxID=451514 RepID=A0A1S7LJ50_MAGMO|nr:conserved protein of unknown function [Candidatus Magnetococcus massalia]
MSEPTFPTSTEDEIPQNSRLAFWLHRCEGMPPEQVAAWQEPPPARWQVVIEDGPQLKRQRYIAQLAQQEDLPFWAYALAKAYLDDVGEWPLFGFQADHALTLFEDHGDTERAVRDVMAAIKGVWPDVEVIFIGQDHPEGH